jgi:drug/metabolite transporter (DMT)-like permease
MWWILQILGCLIVGVNQWSNMKYNGMNWVGFIATIVAYYFFARSYATAPNFVLPWMVGQTALSIIGISIGFMFFKDTISTQQWIGVILSIIGGYLLIK